jgi:DNA-binding beta-propeller fold protein YncE
MKLKGYGAGWSLPLLLALFAAGFACANTGDRGALSGLREGPPLDRQVLYAAALPEPPRSKGTGDYGGDGGPAAVARLNNPRGIALDQKGNLYIADSSNDRIRKIDSQTKVITTVAGNGTRGFAGDGKKALQAQFFFPHTLTVDAAGNLYIADAGNHRIRKVDAAAGIITTVAGNGKTEPPGDGGPAILAGLSAPRSVELDPEGNLYIADTRHSAIRRVGKDGRMMTVAGGDPKELDQRGIPVYLRSPLGIAMGPDGQIYWADSHLGRVKKMDPKKMDPATGMGWITIVAGTETAGYGGDDGPAREAQLFEPAALVLDRKGNLYIADHGNHRIRRVDSETGTMTTIAGNGETGFGGDGGPAADARLNSPSGLALDGRGALYIADSGNHRIRKVDLETGIISTIAGTGATTEKQSPGVPMEEMFI